MRCAIGILTFFLLLSCSIDSGKKKKKPKNEDKIVKDGVTKMYYPDGKLRAEVPMKGGRRNGLATEYYTNGKKHLVINYVDGKNHGLTTRYYDTGGLYEETMYEKGEMHGLRKRYRKDGKLASEAKYNNGNPCIGLKEYLTDGTPKKNYPTIVVEPVDRLLKDGTYSLRLSMSDKTQKVTFYEGQLEGGCISQRLDELPPTSVKGVSEMKFFLPPGMYMMQEIPIVAKVKTPQGNYFITLKKYNLAIENR
jgi:hypothetical protein